jgi:hypothetical protein
LSYSMAANRHREGQEKAIDRLEQVSEELKCHIEQYKQVITREVKKVNRKCVKILKKIST